MNLIRSSGRCLEGDKRAIRRLRLFLTVIFDRRPGNQGSQNAGATCNGDCTQDCHLHFCCYIDCHVACCDRVDQLDWLRHGSE